MKVNTQEKKPTSSFFFSFLGLLGPLDFLSPLKVFKSLDNKPGLLGLSSFFGSSVYERKKKSLVRTKKKGR